MSLLYKNIRKCYYKCLLLGGLILTISLPAIGDDHINLSGQLTLPSIYKNIHPYDGVFIVQKEGLFGLVDKENQPLSANEYYFKSDTLNQAEKSPLIPLIGYKKAKH